mmetsp:Transcript_25945/g.51719  ORF Transcript_25945/g.51719 Transcript_25945/m.51719 type:complete len:487 (+) Transcript_25945:120-1580(+)
MTFSDFGSAAISPGYACTAGKRLSTSRSRLHKLETIATLLDNPSGEVDLWRLREAALSEGGLLNHAVRRRAWPALLGLDQRNPSAAPPDADAASARVDLDQIARDVGRAERYLGVDGRERRARIRELRARAVAAGPGPAAPGGDGRGISGRGPGAASVQHPRTPETVLYREGAELRRAQTRLGSVVAHALRAGADAGGPPLHYYQGYHDVAAVFHAVMGDAAAASACLAVASKSHLGDSTKKDFSDLILSIRLAIFPLIALLDPVLHAHLAKSGVEPFFALSWIVTWFAHDGVCDGASAGRLFDAFLSSHPALVIYLSVAMVTHPLHRTRLLKTPCDFSEIHCVLCDLPRGCCVGGRGKRQKESGSTDGVDYQELIHAAIGYMRQVPPTSLPALAARHDGGSLRDLIPVPPHSIHFFLPPPQWVAAPGGGGDSAGICLPDDGRSFALTAAGLAPDTYPGRQGATVWLLGAIFVAAVAGAVSATNGA